jgi:anaerobic magnesium-protoporphyrin IX monomethyl ester cyclase
MTDIVFANPPFLPGFSRESRSPAVTKSSTLYYPGWLAYACGYAEDNGIECHLFDFVASAVDHASACLYIKDKAPRLLVLGTSTPSIENDISFAFNVKLLHPDAKICLVGTHASSTAEEILSRYSHIDFVARREYDLTIVELFRNLDLQTYELILGLSWRSSDGVVHHEPDRPYLENLDSLPFVSQVYAKYLNIKDYYYGHVSYPMVSIFTSRGCNAKCSYCVYPQTMFGVFRHRTPKSIADELEWIVTNLPEVKEVLIDDDTFSMDPRHAKAVSAEIINRKIRIKWTCEVRANLDYETLVMMKKAGCRLVVVGFESTSQEVLNNVRKGIRQSSVDQFVSDADKAGVKIHACFMAGNPGDTLETLDATLNWALSKSFDTAQFFPVQLYPGTKAYEDAVKANNLFPSSYSDWISSTGMHKPTLIQNDQGITSSQMTDFCDKARRAFYMRPSYILSQVLTTFYKPAEFRKNVKGFFSLIKHL